MALKLNERYPGRFNSPTTQYPQGSFKNRTAPGAKDGSYLEQDWANDHLAFLSSLLSGAGLTANGSVDTVGASQYYTALQSLIGSDKFLKIANNLSEIKDAGPAAVAQTLLNLGLGNMKYGAPMIGELVEWPLQQMPHEIWTDMGMEFIPYMAQSFDPVKYPLLSQLHPTNILPADMRAQVPRGWDNGRGVDTGRVLMSAQDDATQRVQGSLSQLVYSALQAEKDITGPFSGVAGTSGLVTSGSPQTSFKYITVKYDTALVARTASENRPKNIAWNMIVRAK